MENLYTLILLIFLLAMTASTGVGLWYIVISVKNWMHRFGRSLIVNDKSYIFEAGTDKSNDVNN